MIKRQHSPFKNGLRFICNFCSGEKCSAEDWRKNPGQNAIGGLNSSWITDSIIAMQRPSSRLIKEFSLVEKFKEDKVMAVFCLQEPGEHPLCGDGIHKESGLSYLPQELYSQGIHFYNFGWRDHETTNLYTLLKIVKTMDQVISSGEKLAVHCHAGKGRTGLAICSYLIFKLQITSDLAIKIFQQKRKGALSNRKHLLSLRQFEEFLAINHKIYFQGLSYMEIIQKELIISPNGQDFDNKLKIVQIDKLDKVAIPSLLRLIFDRIKKESITNEHISKMLLVSQQDIIDIDYLKIKFQQTFSLQKMVQEELDIQQIISLLYQFFIDLYQTIFDTKQTQNLKQVLDFTQGYFQEDYQQEMISHQSLNIYYIKLLFSIFEFVKSLSNTTISDQEMILFLISLYLTGLNNITTNFYAQQILFKVNWDFTQELKVLKSFIDCMNQDENKYQELESSISITKTPLKNYKTNLHKSQFMITSGKTQKLLKQQISESDENTPSKILINDFELIQIQNQNKKINPI